jgi:hypothetical protein
MDKVSKEAWATTIEHLSKRDEGVRDHFAQLIMTLAKCYDLEAPHKAVVLVDTGEALLTFCAGADEMDMAEMIGHANDMAQAMVLRDAPPKEMFN